MRRSWLGLLLVAALGAACAFPFPNGALPEGGPFASPGIGTGSSALPLATPSPAPSTNVVPADAATPRPDTGCVAVKRSVLDAVAGSLAVRGAYLSSAYAARATDVSGTSVGMGDPWWLAASITGAGVQPELGVWLIDGLSADGTILAANASAIRYSSLRSVSTDLADASAVVQEIVACVGPLPQS